MDHRVQSALPLVNFTSRGKSKERQIRKPVNSVPQNSDKQIDTKKELSERAKVSHNTILPKQKNGRESEPTWATGTSCQHWHNGKGCQKHEMKCRMEPLAENRARVLPRSQPSTNTTKDTALSEITQPAQTWTAARWTGGVLLPQNSAEAKESRQELSEKAKSVVQKSTQQIKSCDDIADISYGTLAKRKNGRANRTT